MRARSRRSVLTVLEDIIRTATGKVLAIDVLKVLTPKKKVQRVFMIASPYVAMERIHLQD